jgi:hypothetical protein
VLSRIKMNSPSILPGPVGLCIPSSLSLGSISTPLSFSFTSTKTVISMRSYFTFSLALAALLSSVLAGSINSDSELVQRGE